MGAWSFGSMCSRCVRWGAVLVDYGMTALCVEHYGRRFWPGTSGYQMVKAPDIEPMVNLRKQFWKNLNNSAFAREQRTREDHQVIGWLMGREHADWMGRLDWQARTPYQMVAF